MPMPFKPATDDPNIPSVGQPVKAAGFSLTVFFVCQCEAPQPLVLSLVNSLAAKNGEGRSVVTCPSCGRQWGLGAGTKLHLDITLSVNRPIIGQN